jgi:hypothetical protein
MRYKRIDEMASFRTDFRLGLAYKYGEPVIKTKGKVAFTTSEASEKQC